MHLLLPALHQVDQLPTEFAYFIAPGPYPPVPDAIRGPAAFYTFLSMPHLHFLDVYINILDESSLDRSTSETETLPLSRLILYAVTTDLLEPGNISYLR